MSVFGIDLGSQYSVVSITRHGGIDVILNDVSKRETAAYVSFLGEERFIGESGLDRAVRNMSNTVGNIKRFIGMHIDDPQLQIEKQFSFCNIVADENGRVMFEVDYMNEMKAFYPEQVLAMFLGTLRSYVKREATKTTDEARDCVISVPSWFTANQRQLVNQAGEIAGAQNGGGRQLGEQGRVALALDEDELALAAIRGRSDTADQMVAMRRVDKRRACQLSNL